MSNSNFDEIFGGNGFNPDEVPNSDSFEPIPPDGIKPSSYKLIS